jgi:hypothetical protein
MGTKIAILEVTLNPQDISSVRLPTEGMTYVKKCFRQRTKGQGSPGAGVDMIYVFFGLINSVSSSDYIVSYNRTITK